MSYVFNPGYIGPNPPCCDPECTDENDCPNAECGPCPGPQAPCGGCSPAVNGQQQNTTENEDCQNKRDDTQHQNLKQ